MDCMHRFPPFCHKVHLGFLLCGQAWDRTAPTCEGGIGVQTDQGQVQEHNLRCAYPEKSEEKDPAATQGSEEGRASKKKGSLRWVLRVRQGLIRQGWRKGSREAAGPLWQTPGLWSTNCVPLSCLLSTCEPWIKARMKPGHRSCGKCVTQLRGQQGRGLF